ncbi:hypothetical protein [Litoribacillus peritrichatus]|uniref:Flagellar hook-length control protein-like C-terminal domain-containing protein n=1 Tax=Litoribacillus peritrichatus TaxID=718191 RepID=A0ABP7M4V6_9GAMM
MQPNLHTGQLATGQFRQAVISPSSSSSISPAELASLSNGQQIKAEVLTATLEQISTQKQSIAQYKAQVVIQGKVFELTTQFPLDKGDQLELKVTNKNQLVIEKVIPASPTSRDAVQNASVKTAEPTSATAQINNTATNATATKDQATQKPITNEQINHVIRMWLSQSRPAIGALLDLSLTMEAANKIIESLPSFQQTPVQPGIHPLTSSQQHLSTILKTVSEAIQAEIFKTLPHTNQQQFKNNVSALIKELIHWQNTPANNSKTETSQPVATANLNSGNLAPQGKQTLIGALLKLQVTIQESLNKAVTPPSTSGPNQSSQQITATPVTSTQATSTNTHIPILHEWTQILSLMTPATSSQNDMLDWMLESIRRISGSGLKTDVSASVLDKLAAQETKPTQSLPPNQTAGTPQAAIDSSQWLKLAEFRKHQLFTGNIKHSLLQSTSDLQISNTLRQLLVNVEELAGRMSALRLASASSQLETSSNNLLHIDLPVMTNSGPTSVEMDMEQINPDEKQENDRDKKLKNHWLVHLKFELPPLAPFIGQIRFDPSQSTLTANFFTNHKETLAFLNKNLAGLEESLKNRSKATVKVNTRFGIIDMPREALIKQTHHQVNVNV